MNKLLNILAGLALGQKAVATLKTVQGWLGGRKSYLAGSVLILQGALCLIGEIEKAGGVADLLGLLKNLATHPGATQVAEGLGIIGLRAGIAKTK